MQDGHAIAYTSRALTPTEIHYAQIEKELPSIVFGVEKCYYECYYVLLRMLLCLQKYEVVYKRGVEIYMADTLSRAHLKKTNTET